VLLTYLRVTRMWIITIHFICFYEDHETNRKTARINTVVVFHTKALKSNCDLFKQRVDVAVRCSNTSTVRVNLQCAQYFEMDFSFLIYLTILH
jgi:hypothetical protein